MQVTQSDTQSWNQTGKEQSAKAMPKTLGKQRNAPVSRKALALPAPNGTEAGGQFDGTITLKLRGCWN